ncbi:MAG: hypothetical protein U0768_05460 [Anaerolineae bacterium]
MAQVPEGLGREIVAPAVASRRFAISRTWLSAVFVPFAMSRLVILVAGVLAMYIMPENSLGIAYHVSPYPWLDMWSRWDAMWYIKVATLGYYFIPGQESTIAFYPLYPALLRGLTSLLTIGREANIADYTIAGLMISNVAFLFALTFLYRLTALELEEGAARRAVWYLAIFPGSIFLSAPYAEPVFLALIILSFYLARRRYWAAGAYAGFLAALSRLVGAFAFIPFLAEAINHWREARRLDGSFTSGLLPLIGAIMFPLYLFFRFGDPLAFIHVQEAWKREVAYPWDAFLNYLREPVVAHGFRGSLLDLAVTTIALVLLVLGARKLPVRYTIFATLVLFASISTGTLTSLVRHTMGAFPLFMTMGYYGRHKWLDQVVVVLSIGLLAVLSVLYALWYWVA